MDKKLTHSILVSYLIGAPIGFCFVIATILFPSLFGLAYLLSFAIIFQFGMAIVGLLVAFLVALGVGGRMAFKSTKNGDSLIITSFKYSFIVNLIIWTVFCTIALITTEDISLLITTIITAIITGIICIILTTFSIGLLITFIIQNFSRTESVERKGQSLVTPGVPDKSLNIPIEVLADKTSESHIQKPLHFLAPPETDTTLLGYIRQSKYAPYVGIVLGGLYGLLIRMLMETRILANIFETDIFTISFICFLPAVIAIIPILFARKEVLESRKKQFAYPILSVFLFFLFAFIGNLEDSLCLLIIGLPYMLFAGISGLLIGLLVKRRTYKKLYSIILLPLLFHPIEGFLPNHKEFYNVESSIIINAPKSVIWENIIEVPEISNQEYNYGFFDYAGVPRPIKSKLEIHDNQEYRVGYFTGGLKLFESISVLDTLNYVSFKIHINKSELRDLPTDRHILNGNYFVFDNISYKIIELEAGKTKLVLNCDYSIESKMNTYGNFWAKRVIKDFEVRLLDALKKKIEKQTAEN